jgi:hypothetical protein
MGIANQNGAGYSKSCPYIKPAIAINVPAWSPYFSSVHSVLLISSPSSWNV